MARFTFAAGNAGKLLRLPLYALGALAAALVPRSDRVWVVGSGIGVGEGALAVAQEARRHLGPDHRILWITGSAAESRAARAAGFDPRRRGGARALWATLRARVAIVTHGFGDVDRYGIGGAFIVQLWHGIPLKRLHLDSPATLRVGGLPDVPQLRALLARAYRRAGRAIDLFPVASESVAARIQSAFGIAPDRVVVTGDPRDDVLLAPDEATAGARRDEARARIEAVTGALPPAASLVLYAPTWRDGRPDPSVPTPDEWRAIAEWAERGDRVLLVRTHPLGVGDYAAGPHVSDRVRMLSPETLRELTPALPAVDALVTDYSSVAFDISLLERPVVYLAPDVEDYAKRRGLYADYRAFTAGRHHANWAEALAELDAIARGGAAAKAALAHGAQLRDEHFDLLDGRAAERVVAAVLARLDHPAAELDATAPRRPRPVIVGAALIDGREHEGRDLDGTELPYLELEIEPHGARIGELVLDGGRARVRAELSRSSGRVHARIPLLLSRWGGAPLALPSGEYALTIATAHPTTRFELDPPTALVLEHELFHAEARGEAGGFRVRIAPPLDGDEVGGRAQAELEAHYRESRGIPEDAVFFESFYSQTASDNPLGIDRALARVRPETRRYWSVVDRSVPVPAGGIPIVEGSREWWRVRAAARVLVVNDWLRKRYRRRAHQKVLQTWHGTMLKRLALDRPGRSGLLGRVLTARTRIAIRRERARWDVLLAQNAYSERIFRSAYAMDGPIWVEGYPRDDALHSADAVERAAAVRARLGIDDGERVVLYAPTWRDDRVELVDYLDAERFAAELGAGWTVLLRGHTRTLRHGHDLDAPSLVDVTSYPDFAELLLVADALVTDYSSAMFDWMATDKPIVFFTPDLAHYADELRGFYFDLVAEAPGPVTETPEQVLAAVRAALDAGAVDAEEASRYAERRAAWRERFAPLDDGRAGERVVRRMIGEGWFD